MLASIEFFVIVLLLGMQLILRLTWLQLRTTVQSNRDYNASGIITDILLTSLRLPLDLLNNFCLQHILHVLDCTTLWLALHMY